MTCPGEGVPPLCVLAEYEAPEVAKNGIAMGRGTAVGTIRPPASVPRSPSVADHFDTLVSGAAVPDLPEVGPITGENDEPAKPRPRPPPGVQAMPFARVHGTVRRGRVC